MCYNVIAVCLICILCIQVRSQVCNRTIITFESTFIVSLCTYPNCYYGQQNIRNVTIKDPVAQTIPACCSGFCIVNPNLQPTSTNCVRTCKGNCAIEACWAENKCYPAGAYLEESRHYTCQTSPHTIEDAHTVKEDTELDNNTNQSVINTTCLNNCHNMDTQNLTCENETCYVSNLCTNESLSGTRESLLSGCLWASVIMNIILLVIIAVITKRHPGICSTGSDGANKKNTTECDNLQEIREDGVPEHIKNRPPLIREESDNGSTPHEALQYDYVQVPLPINKRNIQKIPPRSQFRL